MTLVGSLAGAIHQSPGLNLSEAQIGLTASPIWSGAVIGALGFGWLADRLGRRRLFFITLMVYMAGHHRHRLLLEFLVFRGVPGAHRAGIGGEYAAVNSAIQELIPARRRGSTDLCVNGSFWVGAAIGRRRRAGGAGPRRRRSRDRLARRLRDRRRARAGRPAAAPLHPGKPALADAARPAGGSRRIVATSSATCRGSHRPTAAARLRPGDAAPARRRIAAARLADHVRAPTGRARSSASR